MAKRDVGRLMQELTLLVRRSGNKAILRRALTELIDEVNKEGVRRQLQFLINIVGITQTKKMVNRLCKEEQRIKEIARPLGNGLCPEGDLLVHATYDEHTAKANSLIREGPRDMLRYLVGVKSLKRVENMLKNLSTR